MDITAKMLNSPSILMMGVSIPSEVVHNMNSLTQNTTRLPFLEAIDLEKQLLGRSRLDTIQLDNIPIGILADDGTVQRWVEYLLKTSPKVLRLSQRV